MAESCLSRVRKENRSTLFLDTLYALRAAAAKLGARLAQDDAQRHHTAASRRRNATPGKTW